MKLRRTRRCVPQQTLSNIRNSLSLIRRRKKVHKDCTKSSRSAESVGMAAVCVLGDVGLDAGDSSAESDSSIEGTRDALCGSFLHADAGSISLISAHQQQDQNGNDISSAIPKTHSHAKSERILCTTIEDTELYDVKNSTMNKSAVTVQTENMEYLSPIKKSKNQKSVKIIDACLLTDNTANVSNASFCKHSFNFSKSKPDRVLKVTKKQGSSKVDSGLSKLAESESSDEWSPSRLTKKPLAARKWLLEMEENASDKIVCIPKPIREMVPKWKRCILKPASQYDERSFRTSSPSPCGLATRSPLRKKSLLEVSSIHETISLFGANCATHPDQTVNSNEIAPFTDSSIHESKPWSGRAVLMGSGPLPDDIAQNQDEKGSADFECVVPAREQKSDGADATSEEEIVKYGVRMPVPSPKTGPLSLVVSAKPPSPSSDSDCTVKSDEIYHLPSPIFDYRPAPNREPDFRDVPVDEICLLMDD